MAIRWIHNGGWDPHPEPIEVSDEEEKKVNEQPAEDAQSAPTSSPDDWDDFTCFLS